MVRTYVGEAMVLAAACTVLVGATFEHATGGVIIAFAEVVEDD